MKSYPHQRIPAKKIKKLAARYTDEEIRRSLGPDADRSYLMEVREGCALVGCWTDSGPMELVNDDDVLVYAQVEFLRRQRFPLFRSDAELNAYAKEQGWTVKDRRSKR